MKCVYMYIRMYVCVYIYISLLKNFTSLLLQSELALYNIMPENTECDYFVV